METWFLTGRNVSDKEMEDLRASLRAGRAESGTGLFTSQLLEILNSPNQIPKAVVEDDPEMPSLPPLNTNGLLDHHQSSTESLPE